MTDTNYEIAAGIISRHRGDCDRELHFGPAGPGCSCGVEEERREVAAELEKAAERGYADAIGDGYECGHHSADEIAAEETA